MSDTKIQRFTRIRGNLKNSFDEELGEVTLWIGPNMSGKTGRLITAKIATMGPGGHSGGVKGSDLMRLAAPGSMGLYAALVSPSGSCELKVQTEGGKAKQPDHILTGAFLELDDTEKERMMPMVSMGDLLDLGPDRGRRAVVKRFGNIKTVPTPDALLPAQQALWDEGCTAVMNDAPADADASELLVALNKWFNQAKLDAGRSLKVKERSLEERRQKLNKQAAGGEMLDDLVAQWTQAKAWEDAAGLRARLEAIEAQKIEYREKRKPFELADKEGKQREADDLARRTELEAAIAAAQETFDAAAADVADQEGRLVSGELWQKTLDRAVQMIAEGHDASCPLCTTLRVCKTIDAQHDEWELFDPSKVLKERIMPAVTKRLESVEVARKVRASAEVALVLAKGELAKYEQSLSAAGRADSEARSRLRAEAHRIQAIEGEVHNALKLSEAPTSYEGLTAAELKAEIDAIEGAVRARALIEEETAELRKLEAGRDLAKKMEIESKKLLTALIRDVKATAEASVNALMVPTKRAVIDLTKNAWNVVGVHGKPVGKHEMCGFERCSLVPALAAAYTEGAPARYLVLDDDDLRGFSRGNLRALMKVLVKAVRDGVLTQVFMAHSWLTEEDAPEGVVVHKLSLPPGVEVEEPVFQLPAARPTPPAPAPVASVSEPSVVTALDL